MPTTRAADTAKNETLSAPARHAIDRSPDAKPAEQPLELQRKCACGASTSGGETCDACKGKLQAKLAIGSVDDPLEHEADYVANRVMSTSMPRDRGAVPVRVQRAAETGGSVPSVPSSVERTLSGSGRPLDPPVRHDMEQRFGRDFSSVRIHSDSSAALSARDIGASAYTVGRQIVFGDGEFSPESREGKRLLAHELAHVVQQSESAFAHAPEVVARAPTPEPPKGGNFTPEQWRLLVQARQNLKPEGDSIVGVLIADDGRQIELQSGGGQGFSSHIEGKATAKMKALGIKKATLLSELEPCQLCDRSDYPTDPGPEAPMKSTKTGKEMARQTSKINSALPIDSELKVVGPKSTGIYRGTASVPPAGGSPRGGSGEGPETPSKTPTTEPKARSDRAGRAEPAKPSAAAPDVEPRRAAAPAKTPTAEPARPAARPSAGAPSVEEPGGTRPRVNAELKGGRMQVTIEGGWKWAGRIGTGATFALQLYGAIEQIDGAVARLEKALNGSVHPEVAKAMAALDANFPSAQTLWADKFKSWHEDVRYPAARDWLINNGFQALMQKGEMLDVMGDHLNTVYWYYQYLDDLGDDFGKYHEQLDPIYQNVKRRARALFDVSEDLLKLIPKFPNDTAQLQLFGVYQSFHDAAEDLSRLESQLSMKVSDYEQLKSKARTDRIEAARWINYWSPAYQQVGRKPRAIRVPEE